MTLMKGKPVRFGIRLTAPIMLALLAACSTSTGGMPAPAGPATASLPATPTPAPAVPTHCPENLSAVKDKLVTPYDQLAAFIGPDQLEATLTKPVDVMIERGGGFQPSIASGEKYVKEYNTILADEKGTRDEYHALGKDDAWIDLYLNSVRDGVTINQAFVDAVRCKQAMAQAQQQQN
jgi:hypothetical protein